MQRVILLVAFAVLLAIPATSQAGRIEDQQARAKVVICEVFGPHCKAALDVAWCESKWYVWAQNGQYKGLFQVSAHWRASVPGWGPGAWAQARHAYKVFRLTGSNWSHWECQP